MRFQWKKKQKPQKKKTLEEILKISPKDKKKILIRKFQVLKHIINRFNKKNAGSKIIIMSIRFVRFTKKKTDQWWKKKTN